MGRNVIETIMGGVVLLVAGIFLAFAYNNADLAEVKGYQVKAMFSSVGGLAPGGDVRINGIKVGTVLDQSLDPITYDAVVSMSIAPHLKLPADTAAAISSEGLLGAKFIKLDPGRSEETIADGGFVGRTINYKSIEEMVGELIFLATNPPSATPTSGAAE